MLVLLKLCPNMDTIITRKLTSELFPNYQFNTTSILLSIIASFVFGFSLKYLWNRRFLYYSSWKMHGPSPAWPIIGNALYFTGGTDCILDNIILLAKQFKSPLRIWLGHRLFFGITQPKDLEIIMNRSLHKEHLYDFAIPVVGTGVFTAPVDKWKSHRKVILQTFNQKILNSFVDIFAEQANILVEKLQQFNGKGYFDVFPLISRCALDIICETAMGKKVRAQTQESDYVKWMGRAMEIVYIRMFRLWLHSDFIWSLSPLSKELDKICQEIRKFMLKIIEDKKLEYRRNKSLGINEFCENPSGKKVFLDYLIELSEEGANWDDDEILDEAITLVIAGSDSTSTMDSFILIMLAMHQDIQENVYEELQTIFNDDHHRNIQSSDLPKMVYLERVIKETLRLFPVGPVIVRALYEDIKLDSCTLPRNTSCVLGIIHTHRDPELWRDPLKFDPDRFLPQEIAKRHPYSYIPFSAGPRNCIGPKYAMMAMKTVIATILRRYKITATHYKTVEEIKVKADLIIKAVDGYKIALAERHDGV